MQSAFITNVLISIPDLGYIATMQNFSTRAFRSITLAITLIAVSPLLTASGPTAIKAALKENGKYVNWGATNPTDTTWVRLKFFARRVNNSINGRDGSPPPLQENDGETLRNSHGSLASNVTWIGHATFLIQLGGLSILTDPNWSDKTGPVSFAGPPRLVDPGLALDELPPIDLVVISHNHYDHLDLKTLQALAEMNSETRFLVPENNAELLNSVGIHNVRELNWGQTEVIGNLQVYCMPAQHWSRRSLTDGNEALWSSWSFISRNKHLFFAGDTAYQTHFVAIRDMLGAPDVALLPIGAYEPVAMMKPAHLNPEEAVQAGLDLRAETIVSMHYGTFDLADEPLAEPPIRFYRAARQAGIAESRIWNLKIGETRGF